MKRSFWLWMVGITLVPVMACGGVDINALTGGGALTSTPFAYRKSVAELNQKAALLLQQGNAEGAMSRLEAAQDLSPHDAGIEFNLAIATSMAAVNQSSYGPMAIQRLNQFMTNYPKDARYGQAVQTLAVVAEREANRVGVESNAASLGEVVDMKTLTPEQQAQKRAFLEQALRCYQILDEAKPHTPAVVESLKALSKQLQQLNAASGQPVQQGGRA
ncbi:MAG: hypothetical protein U0003_01745 [Vampirovibrionales bacterium]